MVNAADAQKTAKHSAPAPLRFPVFCATLLALWRMVAAKPATTALLPSFSLFIGLRLRLRPSCGRKPPALQRIKTTARYIFAKGGNFFFASARTHPRMPARG